MVLMADALSVLGSRHGLLMDPPHRRCGIVRFDAWTELPPLEIRAGVRIAGRELVLPLCARGETFAFHDQRMTPCTMSLMGVDPETMLKLKLTVVSPFRPRDAAFSTTPVLGLRLSLEKLPGQFRWSKKPQVPRKAEIFLEFVGPRVSGAPDDADSVDLEFSSGSYVDGQKKEYLQRDRLVALEGERRGRRFVKAVDLSRGNAGSLEAAWVAHHGPVMQVQGRLCPFRYAERFRDLDAVAAWARRHGWELFANAERVDGLVAANSFSRSVNRLLAYTLHSWLINTWWVRRGRQEVFTVWEGNCYFHSTVDVEFTQSPFYLALWPELLGVELDLWPDYSKDGTKCAGDAGRGTLFLSHDAGKYTQANRQGYPHGMEVEETANYLILAYAYAARTGDRRRLRRHAEMMEKYLRFLAAAGDPRDGVPVRGVANTVDDASPAVQFGRKQVYLGVKTLAAFVCGAEIMELAGRKSAAQLCRRQARKIRAAIVKRGWLGDHFATLLDRSAKGVVNPWTGEKLKTRDVPGWDAAQIYTANALAPLDMAGLDVGLPVRRLEKDLRVATERCLREYGCLHSDYAQRQVAGSSGMKELAGSSPNPGWIAMNLLRDIAAFYRGVDLRHLADRYWEWQVVTNTQEPKLFFETFGGNNLCFYPRGVVVWGFFDALAGRVLNRLTGVRRSTPPFAQVRAPSLLRAKFDGLMDDSRVRP